MRIVAIRTPGIGALGERPPGLRVRRRVPATATTVAFFRSELDSR